MIQHQKAPHIKLESSEKMPPITSFGGCGLLREVLHKLGLIAEMKKFLLKQAGYGDDVVIEALLLLLAGGGRCLSDWEYLKEELGFAQLFGACPSVDTLERYLRRLEITIPDRNSEAGQVGYSTLLERLHEILIKKAYQLAGSPPHLTLDMDTKITETKNREALFCYEKIKAYQPMSIYCPELRLILAHEFRDGNVSPQEGQQRMVERCQKLFPEVHFTVRTDSAGYQNDFLDWMTRNRIRYYITADQPDGIQKYLEADKDWRPLTIDTIKTDDEITGLGYPVSGSTNRQVRWRSRTRNYIAIRRLKDQPDLFGKYLYHIMVTNALWETAEEALKRHRGRCGTIEYAQQQIVSQCGMDMMPANEFSVNTAWYSLGCLTHNLLRFLQEHLLPEKLRKIELKTLRFRFLRAAALVIKKARQVILRCYHNHPFYDDYQYAKNRLVTLSL